MNAQEKFVDLIGRCFADGSGKVPEQSLLGIELGTASGIWTEYVLRNLGPKLLHLFTIDPYLHFPGQDYEAGWPQGRHDKIRSAADKKLDRPEYEEILTRIYLTSEEALEQHQVPERVHFVYIDANHAEEFVRWDVEHYWKLIVPGGMMAGHDINLPQVRKVVEENFGSDWDREDGKARVWWVLK